MMSLLSQILTCVPLLLNTCRTLQNWTLHSTETSRAQGDSAASVGLDGAVRALCRICKNISEPANGLVLNRSAQCLPQSFQALYRDLGCLATEFLNYRYHEECRDMFFPNSDSSSVVAKGPVDSNSTDNTHSLRFLSMAFRSVSCRCKFSNNAKVEVRELSEFTLYAL